MKRTVSWYAIAALDGTSGPLCVAHDWKRICAYCAILSAHRADASDLWVWCWSERRSKSETHGDQSGPPPPFDRTGGLWSPDRPILEITRYLKHGSAVAPPK